MAQLPLHLVLLDKAEAALASGAQICPAAIEIIECGDRPIYLSKSSKITMIRIIPGRESLLRDDFLLIQRLSTELVEDCKALTASVLRMFTTIQLVCFRSPEFLTALYCLTGWHTRESVEGSICIPDRMDQTQLW